MKKIPKPELKSATVMSPFDMNKVPFSKTRTVLTPEQLDKIANGQSTLADSANASSSLSDPIPKKGASDPIPKVGGSDPVTKLGGSDTVTKLGSSSSVSDIKK